MLAAYTFSKTIEYPACGVQHAVVREPSGQEFRPYRTKEGASTVIRVDVQLQVGSATETVKVEASPSALQTDKADWEPKNRAAH